MVMVINGNSKHTTDDIAFASQRSTEVVTGFLLHAARGI